MQQKKYEAKGKDTRKKIWGASSERKKQIRVLHARQARWCPFNFAMKAIKIDACDLGFGIKIGGGGDFGTLFFSFLVQ